MGAPKQKWTSEEEDALRAGVEKHGVGKWRTIQTDPQFSHCLAHRSNIDLKDKWRNMSVSCGGQSSREKVKQPKFKALPAVPFSSCHIPAAYASSKEDGSPAPDNSPKNPHDGKGPRYSMMIIEALTTMKEPNGSEAGAICRYIELRHEVPPNFRRLLSSKLRRLVAQNKIEKVEKGYKLMDSSFATKSPTLKQKDLINRPRQAQNPVAPTGPIAEAAATAAYKIAEAEAKSFLASEAIKEAEKLARMHEDAESLVMFTMDILERCSRGEIVILGGSGVLMGSN